MHTISSLKNEVEEQKALVEFWKNRLMVERETNQKILKGMEDIVELWRNSYIEQLNLNNQLRKEVK